MAQLTTIQKALPPTYSITILGDRNLQASPAMALWMQTISDQAAAAIATLPPGSVTHTGANLPANTVVIGAGSSQVGNVPDPGVPDEILVSAGPGQAPRWRTLAELLAVPAAQSGTIPQPEPSPEQQAIIDHILFLLRELVRVSRST